VIALKKENQLKKYALIVTKSIIKKLSINSIKIYVIIVENNNLFTIKY